MHPNHMMPLFAARLRFQLARRKMNIALKRVSVAREFMIVREMTSHNNLGYLKVLQREAVLAIDVYLAAGEHLVIVERLLEKA